MRDRLEEALARGAAHFDRGEYFEAHEAWEEAWRDASGLAVPFFRGLVQAAAACLHASRRNRHGAETLLRKARQHLAGLPPGFRGIDLARVLREVEDYALARDGGDARRPGIHRINQREP